MSITFLHVVTLYKQGPKEIQRINQQVEQGNSICVTASVSREL